MTVETDLYAAVQARTSGRVYPDLAPAGVAAPYIVYQQVGGEVANLINQAISSRKNGRFQFAVWGATRSAVSAIALQIEADLILSNAFQARPIGAPVADYDKETGLYGSRQDFSVWSDR